MKHKDIQVEIIARPAVDWDNIFAWVESHGGQPWIDRIVEDGEDAHPGGEALAEVAGRRCYQSWSPGINPNVTKVREDSAEYLRNVVNVAHGSVFEHAQFTFAIEGVSRVVTHELVRHRVGVAISQESLRYVRLTDIPFRIPDWVAADPELNAAARDLIARMEWFQKFAAQRAGIDDPGKDFHYKKTVTSDMRRFAPIGLLTGMVWSANVRTLRFVVEKRTEEGAEREIRELFHKIGLLMQREVPAIFADFKQLPVEGSHIPAWVPESSKV